MVPRAAEGYKCNLWQNASLMRLVAGALAWARAAPGTDWRPAGFPLLAAGALCGLIGVGAVLFAQSTPPDDMQRYVYREVAGAALGIAVPLFLVGATLSLPLRHLGQAAASAGSAFCLLAVGAFVWFYPYAWNVPGHDYSPLGVVAYGIGLAYLVAALSGGLLLAYVEARERRLQAERARGDDVTDEEVVRDLLETTSRSRLTWGGMRTDDRALDLTPMMMQVTALQGNFNRVGIVATIPAENFGGDVDSLLAFRGIKGQAQEEYDDSPVAALARLRAQQATQRPPTLWERLAAWWRGA